MKQEYKQLLEEMIADIENYWQGPGKEVHKAEACFWIAHHHWSRIKDMVRLQPFSGDCEEIDFFRNVKPAFTCFIDYFVILSECLMFTPADPEAEKKFWHEEAKRFKRFCIKHKDFIQYYDLGENEMDDLYFLRRNYHLQNIQPVIYDLENEFSTSYDLLAGNYLAQKRYRNYVKERLRKLDST